MGVRFSFARLDQQKWKGFFRGERILSTFKSSLGAKEFFHWLIVLF
jgi:hypothetical protein